jgi:hypothetical protein
MAYRRVQQVHDTGCFVACVASLLGKNYWEAFNLIHPYRCMVDHAGLYGYDAKMVQNNLHRVGIKVTPSKERRINYIRRNALLIIRWKHEPNLLHSVLYLPKKKQFLDPAFYVPLRQRTYERQLDSVMLVDSIKQPKRLGSTYQLSF